MCQDIKEIDQSEIEYTNDDANDSKQEMNKESFMKLAKCLDGLQNTNEDSNNPYGDL